MDYQGNSEKAKKKADQSTSVEKKEIKKVIKGEVVVKKKPLGEKVKDLFVKADLGGVARYVLGQVLLPAARNMIVDASTKGIERVFYGENAPYRDPRRGLYGGMRSSYGGSPLPRTDYRHPATRPPTPMGSPYPRPSANDFILESKEEAQEVLRNMHDIVEMYDGVSVADLHELMGIQSSHTDHKWGWMNLMGAAVRPIRGGWLLDLPPAEPIE